RRHAPTEPGVGVLCLLAAFASAAAVIVVGARRARGVVFAFRACRELGASGDLVVIDGAHLSAAAIPGRPGRIVITRSLLRLLSPTERRLVLAHERAHLEGGHHWHRIAVALATAANPLLRPLRNAITLATERWADERAAVELGDRDGAALGL